MEDNMEIAVGATLPNGAKILFCHHHDISKRWIILAIWPKKGMYEYVTWCAEDNGKSYWGHYFYDDLQRAKDDYAIRIKRGF
jgi:hypothetical protein